MKVILFLPHETHPAPGKAVSFILSAESMGGSRLPQNTRIRSENHGN